MIPPVNSGKVFVATAFKLLVFHHFLMKELRVYRCRKENLPWVPESAIAVSPAAVSSMEEVQLAYVLAKKAFESGKNIAKKFKFEFLLWLTGRTDINSALNAAAPKTGDFFVIAFRRMRLAGARKAGLKKKAEPLALERISLSRIKN